MIFPSGWNISIRIHLKQLSIQRKNTHIPTVRTCSNHHDVLLQWFGVLNTRTFWFCENIVCVFQIWRFSYGQNQKLSKEFSEISLINSNAKHFLGTKFHSNYFDHSIDLASWCSTMNRFDSFLWIQIQSIINTLAMIFSNQFLMTDECDAYFHCFHVQLWLFSWKFIRS